MTSSGPASRGGFLLRVWGAGGSAPTGRAERARYGGDTVCFEIRRETPGAIPLIVDLGTGARDLGRVLSREAAAAGRPAEAEILLSHLHLDHIMGAPFFGPLYDPDSRLQVHFGLSADPAYARKALSCYAAPPFFPVEPLRMGTPAFFAFRPGAAFQAAGLTIVALPLNHPGGCCGFRIEGPEGAVCIIGDHEHGEPEIDAGVRRAAEGAALLLYDATYDEAEYRRRHGWGHSTWEAGLAVARDAHVGETLLYHHQPEFADDDLARRDAAIQAAASNARLARQGMVWRIAGGVARPA
jgi:phosphoribosyl 1,2-cyclic phosphodiesterase